MSRRSKYAAALVAMFACAVSAQAANVPKYARRYFNRGMAEMQTAKSPQDYLNAAREFQQAARTAPEWPAAYKNAGLAEEKAESYRAAVIDLGSYLDLAPKAPDAQSVQARINQDRYKALHTPTDNNATDAHVSKDARRHFDRGMAEMQTAKSSYDYEAAAQEFQQAANAAPRWPAPYKKGGLAEEKAESYWGAVNFLRYYLHLLPKAPDAQSVQARINHDRYKALQPPTADNVMANNATINNATANDLIVPGKRIGVFTIGMSEEDLYDRLGHIAPFWTHTSPDGTIQYNFRLPDKADLFAFVNEGKVIEMYEQDKKYHTKEGVHVGSSVLEVHALMGQPNCQWTPPGESEYAKEHQFHYIYYDKIQLEILDGDVNGISTREEPFECDN